MKKPANVILREDPNSIGIPGKGVRNHYQLWLDFGTENEQVLDTTENITEIKKYDTSDKRGTIYLKYFSTGLIHPTFRSCEETTKSYGMTLANPTYIREETGIDLFDIVITKWNAAWMSLPIDDVKSLLPEDYVMVFITNQDSYSRNTWAIVKKEDAEWFNS